MINTNEIIYLHITSWAGLAIGAEHYYGRLKPYDCYSDVEDIELKRKITEVSEARWLNKKVGHNIYKVGAMTNCFNTEKQVIKRAREIYKKYFPKTKIIILGNNGSYGPKEIIKGPREFKKINNNICKIIEYAWEEGKKQGVSDEYILELIEPYERQWKEEWVNYINEERD